MYQLMGSIKDIGNYRTYEKKKVARMLRNMWVESLPTDEKMHLSIVVVMSFHGYETCL